MMLRRFIMLLVWRSLRRMLGVFVWLLVGGFIFFRLERMGGWRVLREKWFIRVD